MDGLAGGGGGGQLTTNRRFASLAMRGCKANSWLDGDAAAISWSARGAERRSSEIAGLADLVSKMTPAAPAPSPDALRIGRLDRVLDQLGEQRVAISHHGLSVSELADRVARLEAGAAADAAVLAPLRELDVPAELAALCAAVEALQRDVAATARHAAEARVAGELRLQAAEARAAAAEVALRQVEAGAAGAAAEQAAALDELRGATKGMLSEVVRRIAEQFDAVQGALEAAIAERAGERAEAAAAAAETGAALGRHEVGLAATAGAADAARALRADLDALAAAAAAAEARAAAGAAAEAEAAAAWRAGLEARLAELGARFDRYRSYVARLRREVGEAAAGGRAAQAALAAAIEGELGGAAGGVRALQRGAAALLAELHGAAAEAAGVEAAGGAEEDVFA